MTIKMKGFGKLQNSLKKLENNVKKISNEGKIPFVELFNYDFMHKNTNFDSIDDFFKYSDIEIESQEDFSKLGEETLDKAVIKFTRFSTWEEMLKKAIEEHLFKGV